MKKVMILLLGLFAVGLYPVFSVSAFEEDVFKTDMGDLTITFVGHGTLYLTTAGKVIHIDPVGRYADYTTLPKADIILVTHEHGDHLDKNAIEILTTESTQLILTQKCADALKTDAGIVLANGDTHTVAGLATIEAVPAYNIKHMRGAGQPFHPKGEGNGYILSIGGKRIYIAGDSENTPEMKALRNIDIAFLPMNIPYTMTPEMAADAATAFKPAVLYPYHFGNTDTSQLVELLKDMPEIEVRIRNMK